MTTKIKPTAYILIGVPGSGKSTWYNRNREFMAGAVYVSSDRMVQQEADRQGRTYDDVHPEYINTAVEMMLAVAVNAIDQGRDIVWDQTNPTAKVRRKKIDMLRGYHRIAVVFPTPDPEEHQRRLSRPGKTIPSHILRSQCEHFTVPTLEEGFDEIWMIDNV
jgi:predicted kinase